MGVSLFKMVLKISGSEGSHGRCALPWETPSFDSTSASVICVLCLSTVGTDFEAARSLILEFNSTVSRFSIPIFIVDDELTENDENFFARLRIISFQDGNIVLGKDFHEVTIVDPDGKQIALYPR